MTAEEVDARLSEAEGDANLLTKKMNKRLDGVIEEHGLGGEGSGTQSKAELLAAELRTAVDRDIEAIRGKAMSYADERKAFLVTEAANAAQALFEATKEKATAAGANQAKLQRQLKYYQGQAMSAETDAEKEAADAQVVILEGQIAELEEAKAAATKQAARLEEANKNSQALSRLADEIASAKNDTDLVIDSLVETQDRIYNEIMAREDNFNAAYEQLDQLRYKAEIETNSAFVNARWLQYDAA